MSAKRGRLAGWAAALSSSAAFSVAPPVASAVIASGLNPTAALVARLWLAAALLLATLAATNRGALRIDRRGLSVSAAVGLATGASILFFFWSLTRLEASIAALLFALNPLAVLAVLALRGERLTGRSLARGAVGLSGVYLLVGASGTVDAWGVGLVVLAVAASTLQMALTQWYLQDHHGPTVTLYQVAIMAAAVTGWWLIEGMPWKAPSALAWAGIATMAVVPTVYARLAMFAAIQRLGSGQVALLVPVETLLTVVWSVLFLDERLAPIQLAGAGLILVSVGLGTWPAGIAAELPQA